MAALTALGDSDLQLQAFADATAPMRADEWVRSRGVTRNTGSSWWGTLVNGEASEADISNATLPGDDHTTLWNINGKPAVYVSQPYGLSLDRLKEICAACDQHGLTVEVGAWPHAHDRDIGGSFSLLFAHAQSSAHLASKNPMLKSGFPTCAN